MSVTRQLIALSLVLGLSSAAAPSHVTGQWELKVEDKHHHLTATLVIEFTDESAQSCMAGDWSRVTVLSATTRDKQFFPVSDPLSFQMKGNELWIGRMQVCDNYLMLAGTFRGDKVSGDYLSVGLGRAKPLGFFTLRRT